MTIALSLLSALTALWWGLCFRAPGFRALFFPPDVWTAHATGFLLADAVLIVLGALVCARWVATRHPRRGAALWVLCGAMGYATLQTLAWFNRTPLAALAMLSATLICMWCAFRAERT